MRPRIPQPAWAVLQALRLDRHEAPPLPGDEVRDPRRARTERAWNQALRFADRMQLTLAWRQRLIADAARIPGAIRSRLDQNLADNTLRVARLEAEFARIAGRLTTAGVDFLVLKGRTHSPAFVADPRLRPQYDFDLYCPPKVIHRARDLLVDLGYRSQAERDDFPVDHLPAMSRPTGWRWRGNFFDPDMPPAVDLHFRFWDESTERLPAPGIDDFWGRRVGMELDPVDQLGYAALHAVRHLLRGDIRLHHLYEIACFFQNHREQADFWERWNRLHSPDLRRLESIALRLAAAYFGVPATPLEPLPAGAEAWFERYAWAPVESLFRPNKHELLLHLSLLASAPDRRSVAFRRLAPLRVPGLREVSSPGDSSLRHWPRYAGFVASRLLYHAWLLFPTAWKLWRWRTMLESDMTNRGVLAWRRKK